MTDPASRSDSHASDATAEVLTGDPSLRLDEREVARLISTVESGDPTAAMGVTRSFPTRQAHVVGITGPPGSGKSTLVDALLTRLRERDMTAAVLAVDPSSTRTGGAVLGDRVRMSRHNTDPGIYIRSMATRGATRGLAGATRDAVRIVEAAGYDLIVVETVGIGQVELDIVGLADTVVVLTVPGLGDAMQMNKAGIMEVGDLYVVNMADRPETSQYLRELKQALAIGRSHASMPAICPTVALQGEGIPELLAAIDAHHQSLIESRDLASRRRSHARAEFRELLHRRWLELLDGTLEHSPRFDEVMAAIDEERTTPSDAAQALLEGVDVDLPGHALTVRRTPELAHQANPASWCSHNDLPATSTRTATNQEL